MKVHKNGAFLAVVPTSPGDFTFLLEATNRSGKTALERRVKVPRPLETSPIEPLAIEGDFGFPLKDITLKPGDILKVSFKGSPGGRATFSIEGLAEGLPMVEEGPRALLDRGEAAFGVDREEGYPVQGIYSGSYVIGTGGEVGRARITFSLANARGEVVRAEAKGRLTVRPENPPKVGIINDDKVVARVSPGAGYLLFLSKGIKVWVTGGYGEDLRLALTPIEEAWVRAEKVDLLPPGTPVPSARVGTVRAKAFRDKTLIRLYLGERLPFNVEQSLESPQYTLTIYGATSDTHWMRYDPRDGLVEGLSWDQPGTGIYKLKVRLRKGQLWGYKAYYEGQDLVLEIRKGPHIRRDAPLRVIKVCLDPGHSPETGAVGPTGLEEKEVNLKIAHLLRKMLLAEGAIVTMTRMGEEEVPLQERPRICAEAKADLMVSIHNNALPDGMDPYTNNGYSVYYYHPQALALSQSLHKGLGRGLSLPDFGLYYGNLFMARITEMPAALVEPAFMILPEQEALLADPKFQRRIARALLQAIRDFLQKAR
ncbi:MAG: N-acetylmuramoyl-L-alanine amidase [candidate division NC10 bacterium]|nr:N-acetylmuramoyl-L-alanine amidase [candidate division NC10 bacterium]